MEDRKQSILVVDDEQHILDVVIYVLAANGYLVHPERDGDLALAAFRKQMPDLVVLDLNLPGMSGLDLFRAMRAVCPQIPVVMLTSRSDEVDRVLGLELGADDYVTKPFSPRELAARVKAVLRRTRPASRGKPGALSFGPLAVDCESFAVLWFNVQLQVTRAEFKFLECLVRHPARVFTRDTLISAMYDGEHVVTDRSIDAYVKRLRRKFAEVRPGYDPIETVHGLGYKLNHSLETLA